MLALQGHIFFHSVRPVLACARAHTGEDKLPIQRHIPLVVATNIEFPTDVLITCPALLACSYQELRSVNFLSGL